MPGGRLLDLNGWLVDDGNLHLACFNEVLATRGIVVDEAAYAERYLGFDDAGAFAAILRDHDRSAQRADIHGLIEDKTRVYARRAARDPRVFVGASDAAGAEGTDDPVGRVSGSLPAELALGSRQLGGPALCAQLVQL